MSNPITGADSETSFDSIEQDRFVVELPKGVRKLRETWKPYREAVLGFRNHWYPAGFKTELEGDTPITRKICGEPIIFRRVDGKIYGLEDRCAHRRVPLSMRLECLTKDTVTCWYHAFTYSWKDGSLVAVLTDPRCDLVGNLHIKSYPVAEAKGIFFVFIGDIEPPTLSDDLPPDFLAEDLEIAGRHISVKANWRWGCENGFDSPHFYIHRNSPFLKYGKLQVPLIFTPRENHHELLQFRTGAGPKGVIDHLLQNYEPIFSVGIGEHKEVISAYPPPDGNPLAPDISMWLPCGIEVVGFPWHDLVDFEFYVPIDEHNHLYFQLIGKTCKTADKWAQHRREVEEKWTPWSFEAFNGDDVLARLGMEDAYEHGDGWNEETLVRMDSAVIAWRQFASKYARGVQTILPARR